MRALTIGSLNLDHVYSVPHLARPGETIASLGYEVFSGGKGLNQSIALARAGVRTAHAGLVGPGTGMILEELRGAGVDASLVDVVETPTGHAIIHVDPRGENSITIYGGANVVLTPSHVERWLNALQPGDIVVLQNETNLVAEIIDEASRRGLKLSFSAAPFTDSIRQYPLRKVDYLFVNESEARALFGDECAAEPKRLVGVLPSTMIVMTLGARGALVAHGGEVTRAAAYPVEVVDTTAAGDTFAGYFLAGVAEGRVPAGCLDLAARAASICVTRKGAAPSIPLRAEVDALP